MKRIIVIAPERNRVIMNDYFKRLFFREERKRKMNGVTEPTGRLTLELKDSLAKIIVKEFKQFKIDYTIEEVKKIKGENYK